MSIYIMFGALLIAAAGMSAEAPHGKSAVDDPTQTVDQDKKPDESESVGVAEVIEPDKEKTDEVSEEMKSEEKKSQTDEQDIEQTAKPEGEESTVTSNTIEPEPDAIEPDKEKTDEVSEEMKPEEEKSQTVEQDVEQKTEIVSEPSEIEPEYIRELVGIKAGHNDSNPVWSPSGEKIAFERSIGDKREIIISGMDGSVVQKIYCKVSDDKNSEMEFFFPGITEDISYNSGISWSPAEVSLVFMSNGGSGNYDLYLLPQLGNKTTIRLTEHEGKDSHPQWSPSNDHLVFVSGRTGKADIYLMKLENKETIQLTDGEKTYLYPQWSPDGKKIAMIYGSNENHDIYLIEDIARPAETLKILTTWAYDDLRPSWSPDGKYIAFYSNYNLQEDPKVWALFVIAADGSDSTGDEELAAKIVAKNVIPDIESGPAWMPDSKRIIYVKNYRQAYNPIYIVNIEEKTDLPFKTTTKMNHDVTCSSDGTIAFRAQVEQWDHIYIAKLKE